MGILDNERFSIITEYKLGNSSLQLAKKYNCSKFSILKLLHLSGTLVEDKRLKIFDETVFDEITEESAYWMGFLMADGNIYLPKGKRNPRITLVLSEKDKEHIVKFKFFLN